MNYNRRVDRRFVRPQTGTRFIKNNSMSTSFNTFHPKPGRSQIMGSSFDRSMGERRTGPRNGRNGPQNSYLSSVSPLELNGGTFIGRLNHLYEPRTFDENGEIINEIINLKDVLHIRLLVGDSKYATTQSKKNCIRCSMRNAEEIYIKYESEDIASNEYQKIKRVMANFP